MTLRNDKTGEVLIVPAPDELGHSTVVLGGRVIFEVRWSDSQPVVTLSNGMSFCSGEDFADYLIAGLRDSREWEYTKNAADNESR